MIKIFKYILLFKLLGSRTKNQKRNSLDINNQKKILESRYTWFDIAYIRKKKSYSLIYIINYKALELFLLKYNSPCSPLT